MSKREGEAPEDSVALRVIVYCMTLTCILASCIFIKTSWPVIVLALTLCTVGSVVSYQYRYEKQGWMQIIVIVGVLAVGANALSEFLNPMNGLADFWGPVVHFIAGTFALHTFDLKSRSDINLSAMLGALILCCISPIGRSVYFGATVLTYISFGTMMLYYDCMSRSLTNWLDKPMQAAPIVPTTTTEKGNRPKGSAKMTLALLPFITLLSFMFIPRSDDTIDIITSTIHNFSIANLLRLVPDFTNHNNDPKIQRNPYIAPIRNLGTASPGTTIQREAVKHAAPQPDGAPKKGAADKLAKAAPGKASGEALEKAAKEKAAQEKAAQEKSGKASKDGKDAKSGKNGEGKSSPGKDSHGNGKGSGSHGANGSTGGGAGLTGIISAKNVDLDFNPVSKFGNLLFKVSSTRLFWERRAVFDNFDGRYWTRSKDLLKPKDIKISAITSKKDGVEPESDPSLQTSTASLDPAKQAELESAEADRQLEEERLRSLDGQLSGFGAESAVHYVFARPEKPNFDLKKANALIVPKIMPSVELTQSYEMVGEIDNVLPVCWIPQNVGLDTKNIVIDDYGMVWTAEPVKKGTNFKVVSQLPLYDTTHMRRDPGLSADQETALRKTLANYLQLPQGLSPQVVDFADTAVGTTGNWFSQADKLCHVVRTQAAYEEFKPEDFAPAEDRIKQFLLERRLGNSQDFASAYVVMCRAVGLPARLVNGYGIGTTNKVTGLREVRTNDLHFWAEVFIPDYGWVPFDAVPEGILPAQARDEGYNLAAVQKLLEEQTGMNLTDEEGMSPRRIAGWVAIIVSSLFLLAGLAFGLILFLRHLKGKAALNRWRGPEWKIYLALVKDLKSIKIERLESESSQQFVQRVGEIVADRLKQGMSAERDLPATLADFFAIYEAMHFGNKELAKDLKQKAADVRKLVKSKGK